MLLSWTAVVGFFILSNIAIRKFHFKNSMDNATFDIFKIPNYVKIIIIVFNIEII